MIQKYENSNDNDNDTSKSFSSQEEELISQIICVDDQALNLQTMKYKL
jgi:hypothetical protein